MLRLTVPASEKWDEVNEQFIITKECDLQLEHSLVSISKWEAKWCKPFLGKEEKTVEQTIDYIRCMTLTQNVDPRVYDNLTNENFREINRYVDAPMTGTTFSEDKRAKKTNRQKVTSELIYYWMIALNIPFECQKWHLNRLLTLIRVCDAENNQSQGRNKGRREMLQRRSSLNAARRKKLNTRG